MGIFDKIGNWLNEAYLVDSAIQKSLMTMYAVDKPLETGASYGNPEAQFEQQARFNLIKRNLLFNEIDKIANHHISTTIKDIIVSDGFNDLCGVNAISICYEDDDDKKKAEEFNESIKKMLKRTDFLNIIKDCVANEGLDYGEVFLSMKLKNGHGIISISDDMDIRQHLAIYKNTELIGVLRFNITPKGNITGTEFISPDKVAHFMLNYKKISINISKGISRTKSLPEKIRCALPILTPVIDLIKQYNQLEQLRTAIELDKATQGVVLGYAINPDQDQGEIRKEIQGYTQALNTNRDNIINNLDSLDVTSILQSMRKITLVPYSSEDGTNSLKQVAINKTDDNLSEKINDLRKTIALAVGVPEQYLTADARSGSKDSKEDSLLTNPRYSRMLSKIQQLLAKGAIDMVYKHLKAQYTTENGILKKQIDKDKIHVQYKSTTNLNDRLEKEEMMLNVETLGNLVATVDSIASSPNIPYTVEEDAFGELWKEENAKYPHVKNLLRKETPEERAMYAMGNEEGSEGSDIDPETSGNPDSKDEQQPNTKEIKTEETIEKTETKNNKEPLADENEEVRDVFQ